MRKNATCVVKSANIRSSLANGKIRIKIRDAYWENASLCAGSEHCAHYLMWRNIGFFCGKNAVLVSKILRKFAQNGFYVGLAVKNDFYERKRCEF